MPNKDPVFRNGVLSVSDPHVSEHGVSRGIIGLDNPLVTTDDKEIPESEPGVPWVSPERIPGNDQELSEFIELFYRDRERTAKAVRENNRALLYDAEAYEGWPSRLLDQLIFEGRPEDAWPLVVELVEQAPSEDALGYVAAGPLEDLIQQHGDAFADRTIERARADQRWRSALLGVWGWQDVSEPFRRTIYAVLEVPKGMELR